MCVCVLFYSAYTYWHYIANIILYYVDWRVVCGRRRAFSGTIGIYLPLRGGPGVEVFRARGSSFPESHCVFPLTCSNICAAPFPNVPPFVRKPQKPRGTRTRRARPLRVTRFRCRGRFVRRVRPPSPAHRER